ncbi:MAG TPA: FHA domain-containing protein [Coriobacteriia bacterium]
MEECPACGSALEPDAQECPSCGAVVHELTAAFPPVAGPHADVPVRDAADSDGPVLVVRKGPEIGERFYLDRPRLTVGRDPASDIFLNDITVSREHAVLTLEAGSVSIKDVGSLNGVYVNGASVTSADLKGGDAVQIGRFQMVFHSGGGK